MVKNWLKWVVPTTIVGGAACILCYTVLEPRQDNAETASLTERINKITFEEAKKDERKRQAYIDQLIAQNGRPHYLAEVVYSPDEETSPKNDKNEVYRKLNIPAAMATRGLEGTFKDLGKRKVRAGTKVTKLAFNHSEEFFILALFSHERTIARCIYEGLSKVPMDTVFYHEGSKEKISHNILTLLLELEACGNDIDFCKKNRASELLTNDCISDYKRYYHSLATGFPDAPEELRKKIDAAVLAYKRNDLD